MNNNKILDYINLYDYTREDGNIDIQLILNKFFPIITDREIIIDNYTDYSYYHYWKGEILITNKITMEGYIVHRRSGSLYKIKNEDEWRTVHFKEYENHYAYVDGDNNTYPSPNLLNYHDVIGGCCDYDDIEYDCNKKVCKWYNKQKLQNRIKIKYNIDKIIKSVKDTYYLYDNSKFTRTCYNEFIIKLNVYNSYFEDVTSNNTLIFTLDTSKLILKPRYRYPKGVSLFERIPLSLNYFDCLEYINTNQDEKVCKFNSTLTDLGLDDNIITEFHKLCYHMFVEYNKNEYTVFYDYYTTESILTDWISYLHIVLTGHPPLISYMYDKLSNNKPVNYGGHIIVESEDQLVPYNIYDINDKIKYYNDRRFNHIIIKLRDNDKNIYKTNNKNLHKYSEYHLSNGNRNILDFLIWIKNYKK